MFSKLAFQNVRRSLKDYSVYFLTLTFGVCIFYVFNSMESQVVICKGWFLHPNTYDCGSFVVN